MKDRRVNSSAEQVAGDVIRQCSAVPPSISFNASAIRREDIFVFVRCKKLHSMKSMIARLAPEERATWIANARAALNTPEERARRGAASKRHYQTRTPEQSASHIEKLRQAQLRAWPVKHQSKGGGMGS